MWTIFTKIPFYVWPLLGGLIFSGMKARKTTVLSLKIFWGLPIIFFTLSAYSVVFRYGITSITLFFWAIPFITGVFIGIKIGNHLKVRFDKKFNQIEIPGSLFTLTLALTIFCCKFFIRISSSVHPEWVGSFILLIPEAAAAIACGTFIGRSIALFKKYKNSTHLNLV